MNVSLRDERPGDEQAIRELTRAAFEGKPYAAGTEHLLVGWLRAAGALRFSLVAVLQGRIVGHVALSEADMSGASGKWYALGPISVEPALQRKGIGSMLVSEALRRIRGLGAAGCVLSGDPAFYSRFGFARDPAVELEGEPPEYTFVLRFIDNGDSGFVRLHEAFTRQATGPADRTGRRGTIA